MNRYVNPRNAPVCGLAAALASCAVMILAVYAPTRLPAAPDARVLARFAPIEVAIETAQIEVIGIRSQMSAGGAALPVPSVMPNS